MAEFYLRHRLSEDFDFFTAKDISYFDLRTRLEKVFQETKIRTIQYRHRQGLSSKIFFLEKAKTSPIKMEFHYFPFKILKEGKKVDHLKIDSLLDITVNKLHAILTRAAARDFVDFYFIQKNRNFPLKLLLNGLKKKFTWQVDPLFLAGSFIKARSLKDYPKIIAPFSLKEFYSFFNGLALDLKKSVVEE
ncbi:nucleotidyl transferase AbiEii/AbiGii toxin family protein [Patescibacteria group bacterium]|nr:nucleotidyl transferase AbiEii/AbiGii toxin family protein [Patescibacteria group bacterium]